MNSCHRARIDGERGFALGLRLTVAAFGRIFRLGLVAFALWGVTGGPNPGFAQQARNNPPPIDGNQATRVGIRNSPMSVMPIRIDVDWVILPMTVVDEYGYLQTDLEKHHFEVFDDKVRQNILSFGIEDSPLAVGIIFDTSGSIGNKIQKSREALLEFFKTSHPDDLFMLVAFSDRPYWISTVTRDYEKLLAEALFVPSKGRTALMDAIYEGLERLRPVKFSRKALLVVSDGADNHSRRTYRDVRKLIRESNVQIYTIGVFEPPGSRHHSPAEVFGPSLLAGLAQISGGRSYSIGLADELPGVTGEISRTLRSQYVVGYKPSNLVRDGGWRQINVKLRPPDGLPQLKVYTRAGYYAPTQ